MNIILRPAFVTVVASIATAWLTPALEAADVTGSIGFGSLGASVPGGDLPTAGSFTLTQPFISSETGVYTGVPLATPITFNGFQFSPTISSVTPLWSFSTGSINYSFDVTSMTSKFNSTLDEWDIGGNGVAMVTGFNPTPSVWNVNLSQSGGSIVFDSSAAPTAVPEASIIVLLGGGLLGLAGIVRKFNC